MKGSDRPWRAAATAGLAERHFQVLSSLFGVRVRDLHAALQEVGDEEIVAALEARKFSSFLAPDNSLRDFLQLSDDDRFNQEVVLSSWANWILRSIEDVAKRKGLESSGFLKELYTHGASEMLQLEDEGGNLVDITHSLDTYSAIRIAMVYLKKVLMKDRDPSEFRAVLRDMFLEGTAITMRLDSHEGMIPAEIWQAMSDESRASILESFRESARACPPLPPELAALYTSAMVRLQAKREAMPGSVVQPDIEGDQLNDSVGGPLIILPDAESQVVQPETITEETLVSHEGATSKGYHELIRLAVATEEDGVLMALFGVDANGFFYDNEGQPY